jgi:hypothetical protein
MIPVQILPTLKRLTPKYPKKIVTSTYVHLFTYLAFLFNRFPPATHSVTLPRIYDHYAKLFSIRLIIEMTITLLGE